MDYSFIDKELKETGLCVLDNLDMSAWQVFKERIFSETEELILRQENGEEVSTLNINEVRLRAYKKVNEIEKWDYLYYSMASSYLDYLLGPDLLIQRKLNLSVQLPGDKTSTLGMHADTLSGQSPFELVLWIAFTDAFESNGMFYFDREVSREIFQKMPKAEKEGLDTLKELYWPKVKYLDLKASQIVLFSGTIFHGNIINETDKTRISLNSRFKNLFSPQTPESTPDRKLGIFYKVFRNSSVTEIGKDYLEREVLF